jgi:hypothetical protein
VAGKRLREFECQWGPQLVFKADQIVEETRKNRCHVKIREKEAQLRPTTAWNLGS